MMRPDDVPIEVWFRNFVLKARQKFGDGWFSGMNGEEYEAFTHIYNLARKAETCTVVKGWSADNAKAAMKLHQGQSVNRWP